MDKNKQEQTQKIENKDNKTKVVIIGAGPAGITTAYELQKTKELRDRYDITVLEQSNDIGGISKTENVDGNRIDMGGHRFFSKNDKVMQWWFNILPMQGSLPVDDIELGRKSEVKGGGPDPMLADNVMLVRNRVSRIYFKHKFFDYPVKMNFNTIKNMGFITTMKCGFGYLGSCIHKLPEDNLENFYINRFGRPLYSMFFEGYTEKLWGRHPREISADWGAQRVKGLSITAMMKDIFGKAFHIKNRKVETSLIESFYYPKFGPGQLWEKALNEAKRNGVKVYMNTTVDNVGIHDGKVRKVYFRTPQDGGTLYDKLECDYVVSQMPLKDLIGGIDKTERTEDISKIADGLPYRDFMTCGILVDKLAVENKTDIRTYRNQVPDCWIYVQDSGVTMGRVQIFNNWQPYMLKDVKNKVWIGTEYFCNEGDNLWNMQNVEFSSLAIRELKKIGLISNETRIEMTHVERVKKAYPAYFDTYAEIDKLQEYLNGIDGLLCVGRNGQHHYNNMDHSMLTAFTAVDIIEGKDGVTKEDLWNVNAEKEYHEEK